MASRPTKIDAIPGKPVIIVVDLVSHWLGREQKTLIEVGLYLGRVFRKLSLF